MRWSVFLILAYVFLGLELGLADLLQIGANGPSPSWLIVVMVYVASVAPALTALWAAMILGILNDLSAIHAGPNETVQVILGPYAIGYVLGALATLQLRTVVYRRHPLTMSLLALVSGLAVHATVWILYLFRDVLAHFSTFFDPVTVSAWDSLVARLLLVLYTAAFALPLGWLLIKLGPLFGFQVHPRFAYGGT